MAVEYLMFRVFSARDTHSTTRFLGLGGIFQLLNEMAFRLFCYSSKSSIRANFARYSLIFFGLFQASERAIRFLMDSNVCGCVLSRAIPKHSK